MQQCLRADGLPDCWTAPNLVLLSIADLANRGGIEAKLVGDGILRSAIFLHDAPQKLERRGVVSIPQFPKPRPRDPQRARDSGTCG